MQSPSLGRRKYRLNQFRKPTSMEMKEIRRFRKWGFKLELQFGKLISAESRRQNERHNCNNFWIGGWRLCMNHMKFFLLVLFKSLTLQMLSPPCHTLLPSHRPLIPSGPRLVTLNLEPQFLFIKWVGEKKNPFGDYF